MVEVYGWTITEEGEPANGAKFVITIPSLIKMGKRTSKFLNKLRWCLTMTIEYTQKEVDLQ